MDERDGPVSGSNKAKKSKSSQKALKRKSSKTKTMRPQRVAARNARSMFSRISGTSSGEDDSDTEYESSNSDLVLQDSHIQSEEADRKLQIMRQQRKKEKEQTIVESAYISKSFEVPEPQSNNGNRKRLVLKFSLRDSKKPLPSESTSVTGENQVKFVHPSSRPSEEITEDGKIGTSTKDLLSTSAGGIDAEMSPSLKRIDFTNEMKGEKHDYHLGNSPGDEQNKIRWGEVKIRTSKRLTLGVVMPIDTSNGLDAEFDGCKKSRSDIDGYVKL